MRIAITRLKEKAEADRELCRRYGHECRPVSPLAATPYPGAIREFVDLANRGEFDCIFFSSALPARYVAPLLGCLPRIVAIGPQTARTLGELGIEAETLPGFYSRDLAPYLGPWLEGKRIGIPRADVPNPALLDSIRNLGGIPHEVRVYGLAPTGERLNLDETDVLLFTSAGSFSHAIWDERPGMILAAIGEVTAAGMAKAGKPARVVGDGSLEGTLKALNREFGKEGDTP